MGEETEYICQDPGGVDELSEELAVSGTDLLYSGYFKVHLKIFIVCQFQLSNS